MRIVIWLLIPGLLACAGAASAQVAKPEDLEPPSVERGAELWGKCRACHTIEARGRNIVGPRLHGVFGRKAGSVADYRYSEAMKTSSVVWTEQTMDAYLAATQDFMPGNKMYGGLAIAQDRVDLIAWLRQASSQ
ncbi:MAG: cytochrome c family protein [Ferrovibrio sp.]|uniref:c-type cytochrome n=1 Tax=Ferrovibrio sp. TaxID=1917215 RepID=UPI002607CD2D|nr:cytochrome c family protein [Ferrovibrio sp.]MCW0232543.1 cytochrome c family protein [Ferrovibrio sp.]